MFESLSLVQLSVIILVPIACLSILSLIYILIRYRPVDTMPGWLEAQQYANMKELSQEQWLVLRSMLKHYAAGDPFDTLTDHREFDSCVRKQIDAISGVAQRDTMGETLREIRTALSLEKIPEEERWSSTLNLTEKQIVKARPLEQNSSPLSEFYVAHVNDAYFFLTPRNPELAADIAEDSQYLMQVCHPGDARYEFVASVAAIRSDPVRLLFGHVFESKRMQARAHERSAYTIPTPMDIFVVPEENEPNPTDWLYENDPQTRATATFMNLSAGGYAAMLHTAAPPNHSYARVTVTLGRDDFPPFTVFSQVIGTVTLAEDRTLVRASFVDMTPKQEEAIEIYVAEVLQREQEMEEA
ncbi:MAG: hypothetical protein KAH38_09845 [Candidatus Hydrogenedentes bacterium]|nr:hypothetical protein [Candidatus Hydrogenedentota bacterium]